MNVGEVSTSPEFPVQEKSEWVDELVLRLACGINGKSGSLARKIPQRLSIRKLIETHGHRFQNGCGMTEDSLRTRKIF